MVYIYIYRESGDQSRRGDGQPTGLCGSLEPAEELGRRSILPGVGGGASLSGGRVAPAKNLLNFSGAAGRAIRTQPVMAGDGNRNVGLPLDVRDTRRRPSRRAAPSEEARESAFYFLQGEPGDIRAIELARTCTWSMTKMTSPNAVISRSWFDTSVNVVHDTASKNKAKIWALALYNVSINGGEARAEFIAYLVAGLRKPLLRYL